MINKMKIYQFRTILIRDGLSFHNHQHQKLLFFCLRPGRSAVRFVADQRISQAAARNI